MSSKPRLGPLRPLILASMLLALPGCAATPNMPVILSALDCSKVIPPSYRQPVPGAPLPPDNADAGDLWDFADGQTAALSQANGRSADLVAMADACQQAQAKVLAAVTPRPWWRFWTR